MQIDWVTVSAQIINFLVLVYLLKRFLYAPIVNAMDKRQQAIAASLADAQHKADNAVLEAERYRQLTEALEKEKETLLNQAREEVAGQRQQLLEQARHEVAEVRDKWLAEVERDKDSYRKSVRQALAHQVCDVSRQVLDQLADVELEERMIRVFVRKLYALGAEEKTQLLIAARTAGVEISSAFPISAAQQAELRGAIETVLGERGAITFVTGPEPVCGLALRAQGFKVVWSVNDYLLGIEDGLSGALLGGVEP